MALTTSQKLFVKHYIHASLYLTGILIFLSCAMNVAEQLLMVCGGLYVAEVGADILLNLILNGG